LQALTYKVGVVTTTVSLPTNNLSHTMRNFTKSFFLGLSLRFKATLASTFFFLVGSVFAPTSALSQTSATYPTKPIRLIVPYPAGGPLDLVARSLADKLREPLGQTVVVENKPGAGGNIGADLVAKAAPDGYTLLLGAVATHAINPYLYAKIPYDPNRDFTAITRLAVVPNVLVMNPDRARALQIESLKDLISYAKKNPGKLNYASGGNGSAGHLAGELFKSNLGISMVHIAYSGAPPAQIGLIGGQTELMFDNLASAAAQIRAGKLKPYAVTSINRSSFFPEIPTLAESGVANFDISTWFGVFTPASVPGPIVTLLHKEILRAMDSPELKERLSKMGADPATMTSADFAKFIQGEQLKYQKVIKTSGAKID
jgi:tripartite-type tricarboxylate transporter receptor subunit TctC